MFEKLKKIIKWFSTVEEINSLDFEYEDNEYYDAYVYDFNMQFEVPAEEAEYLVKEIKEFIENKLRDRFEYRDCFFNNIKISPIDVAGNYPNGLESLTEEVPKIDLPDNRTA